MIHSQSRKIFEKTSRFIPGGVNSPVRAFGAVGMTPVIASFAHGSHLTDVDGNTYVDYICSWGPLIFGHSPDFLGDDIAEAFKRGVTYGLPTEAECEMAQLLSEAYPAAEMVRMVNSGTEATMSAIRVARGYTGRNKIVKFEGCYHGHSDCLLVSSGSGTLTYGVPTSPGVPAAVVEDTIVCPYNDAEALERIFRACGGQIACVIVEPIAGNMGLVPGKPEFLAAMRRLCSEYGSVLIFDEVISGFRAAYGGAAEIYGVQPDMVCFGKIIGAGMPVGAYGGLRKIMECVSPAGSVYQAGTLSGNPLAMHMGTKVLRRMREERELYEHLDKLGLALETGIRDNLKKLSLPYRVKRSGSLLCLFFVDGFEIENYDQVKLCDVEKYAAYFRGMLDKGILLPPAQFECMFISAAHSAEDIEKTIEANYAVLEEVR